MHRPRALALPALLILAVAPAARSQDDLDRQVRQILSQADAVPLEQVWEYGQRLGQLEGQEDSLARAIGSAVGSVGNRGRLAAASGLRDLADGEVFGKEILEILEPVFDAQSSDEQAAALSFLGSEGLFNRRLLPKITEILTGKASDPLREPRIRIEAARALWSLGGETEKRTAKNTLLEFLKSRDRELKAQAALALAEINTDSSSPGWEVLREISSQPTPEGRLAQSYLLREQERRMFDQRLRQILMQQLEQQKGEPGRKDEFATLRELMFMAGTQHIRGGELKDGELIESAAKGLMGALDRHSSYFSSDEFQRFFFDLNREYGGIGAFVNFDPDGDFSIIRPIYSGPAYDKGLRSGDKILEVDGWETSGHTSEEIIAKLKGKPKTPVVVKIMRPGLQLPQDVAIVREQIHVPSVNYEMLPGKVGYLELVNFAQSTAYELKNAITDLKRQGAIGLVLDVRNNTGGFLQAAVQVCELFLDGKNLVVYTKGRTEDERKNYETRDRAIVPDMPLAVLVNNFSASASEITAGALQDHGRAVIVGERSYGKGSVQQLLPLRTEPPEEFVDKNDNGVHDEWEPFTDTNDNGKYDVGPHMKLTVARYYLPSGRCLHKDFDRDGKILNPDWGIVPDREIDLREISPKDAWKNAEIFDLFKQNKFQDYVKSHLDGNQELFLELADGDHGDFSQYPDFEEFYQGLDTHLPKDDVRRWLRYLIRDGVADLRGKAYPGGRAVGDFQEDAQLQEGMRAVLSKAGIDVRDLDELKKVLKLDFDEKDKSAKK